MERKPLLSITASDCRWDYFRGSGAGGQKRNKTSSAVRCSHEPSGAVGTSQDGRSQIQNRRLAFRRMAESVEFSRWLKGELARRCGALALVDAYVNREMRGGNIRVEVQQDGKWVDEKETGDDPA